MTEQDLSGPPQPKLRAYRVVTSEDEGVVLVVATSFAEAVRKATEHLQISECDIEAVFLQDEEVVQ